MKIQANLVAMLGIAIVLGYWCDTQAMETKVKTEGRAAELIEVIPLESEENIENLYVGPCNNPMYSISMDCPAVLTTDSIFSFTVIHYSDCPAGYLRVDFIPNFDTPQYDPFNNYQILYDWNFITGPTQYRVTVYLPGRYICIVWYSPVPWFVPDETAMYGWSVTAR